MTGTDVVPVGEYETGLEEYALLGGGVSTPRIVIDHDEAVFKDSQTGEEWDTLVVVPLGTVVSRILWPPEMTEDGAGDDPLCRALDAKLGTPGEKFPWKASGWKKSDLDAEGHLDCAACPLKDWDSHPTRETAWCTEQITVPVMRMLAPGKFGPALITFQRSSMKDAKKYFQAFSSSQTPPFIATLTLTLESRKRGKVEYCVPKFKKGAPTDDEMWDSFAEQFRAIRTFLRTPFVRDDDETEDDAVEAEVVPEKPKSKKKKPAPEPEVDEAEVVPEEDDDDPEIAALEAALAAKRAKKAAPAPAAEDNDDDDEPI